MDSINSLMKSLSGPYLWLIVIWALWTGYQIGKEAKTNWFSQNSQQESSIVEKKIAHNDTQQIDSRKN